MDPLFLVRISNGAKRSSISSVFLPLLSPYFSSSGNKDRIWLRRKQEKAPGTTFTPIIPLPIIPRVLSLSIYYFHHSIMQFPQLFFLSLVSQLLVDWTNFFEFYFRIHSQLSLHLSLRESIQSLEGESFYLLSQLFVYRKDRNSNISDVESTCYRWQTEKVIQTNITPRSRSLCSCIWGQDYFLSYSLLRHFLLFRIKDFTQKLVQFNSTNTD